MKKPSSFLTNTTTPAGRANGQAINDPGGDTGSGMDQEIYNDPAYALIAPIESYKDGGISDTDETTLASDMRDTLEEMTEKRITDSVTPANSVDEWLIGTAYAADGLELVTWKGYQFLNYSDAVNTGNDPLLNPDLWMKIPKSDTLLDYHFSGESITGGLSTIADRANAKFRQHTDYGRYRLGGNGDDFGLFSRVSLDGSVVTGVPALNDDIFKEGTADEYWNLDLIAPDVLGTRTLLDLGDYVSTPQSSGGDSDTVGDLVEDQFQGHDIGTGPGTPAKDVLDLNAGGPSSVIRTLGTGTNLLPISNGVDGTPRTGLRTHGKRFTHGASYIIVMNVL